jgi:hypothetical protein
MQVVHVAVPALPRGPVGDLLRHLIPTSQPEALDKGAKLLVLFVRKLVPGQSLRSQLPFEFAHSLLPNGSGDLFKY